MNGRTDGRVEGQMDGGTDWQMNGWRDGMKYRCTDKQMDRRMDGWLVCESVGHEGACSERRTLILALCTHWYRVKWTSYMCQPSQYYAVFLLFVTSRLPQWTQYQLCCHCWYKSRCVQRNAISSANAVSSLCSLFKLCAWPGGSIGRAGSLCSVGNFFCREQEKGSWPGSLQEGRGKYKHPPPLLLLPHSETDARNQYFTWIPFRVMGCPCQLFRAVAYGSFVKQNNSLCSEICWCTAKSGHRWWETYLGLMYFPTVLP